MSAADHLSGLQFSHHVDDEGPFVRAKIGKVNVGHLDWDHHSGEIENVVVEQMYQRRGIATGMLGYARGINPKVKHSSGQTDEGKAWADHTP